LDDRQSTDNFKALVTQIGAHQLAEFMTISATIF